MAAQSNYSIWLALFDKLLGRQLSSRFALNARRRWFESHRE
jgi:hypothetical protein